MAKDGTNRGGVRAGAGRKPKALAEKVLEGNPGKRPLEVLAFPAADLRGEEMPPPREYLAARQKDGASTQAVEVYGSTWRWLHERGCAHLLPPQVLETYAQTAARWIQCEEAISAYGFLGKHPTTGAPIPSPFVAMSQSFMKQCNSLWGQIYQVVRDNCAAAYEGRSPQDDVMEALLSARRNA
ncbi:MAG: P27 family phage terminase small subunit [Oscillospiraceae bacterium]|nr:P27 family phage terminase small subunit [Oscillospiraceae bacterium]